MKSQMKKQLVLGFLTGVTMISVATDASGPFDNSARRQTGDVYGVGEYLTGWETTTFYNGSLALKFDSGFGGGLGLGFNLGNHFNLNTEIAGAGFNLQGSSGSGVSLSTSVTELRWNVGLDYYLLKTRLTPLLSAEAGVMHFGGDFGDSRTTFSETDFSYGVGAGVRWDISAHWFVKAVYRINWTSLKDSDHATMFHSVGVAVGYSF